MRTKFRVSTHTREEWLEERRKGLGGSDTPVILLGERHPFTTPRELWEEKLGLRAPKEETPAMRRGKKMEDLIAQEYAEITGRKVRRVNRTIRNNLHPWMLGNVDREIIGMKGRGVGILEIKCLGLRSFSMVKREGIPSYTQIQLQHYLEADKKKWGSFAIFNAELWELIWLDVDRDEGIISDIISKGSAFWELVQKRIPPDEGQGEKKLIFTDLPPLQTDSELVKIDGDEWAEAVQEYRMSREILEEAKGLKEGAEEKLKAIMSLAGASVAEGAGLRAYWKEREGNLSFDHKGFGKAHPELGSEMERFYKRAKGSRPFTGYFLKNGGMSNE